MKRIIGAAALLIVLTSGCAASAQRMGVYPTQGQGTGQIAKDRAECEEIARGVSGDTLQEAAASGAVGLTVGAVIGAGLGAILGAFLGAPGEAAALGAALGAAVGGIQGAGGGAQTNQVVFQNNFRSCMVARGYTVGG